MEDNFDKYLVVKAKGGMGNRMLCAVTGILYGSLAGRKVVVDWRDKTYSNDGTNSFSKFFSCSDVYPEKVLPENMTVYPQIWEGQINKSIDDMLCEYDPDKHSSIRIHSKYSVNIHKLEYEYDTLVFWYYQELIKILQKHFNCLKDNEFFNLPKNHIIQKVLREKMVPVREVREKIAIFKEANWAQEVIGLHIRHTDRKTDLVKYVRALRRFRKRSPNAHIFLATDNREVIEDYASHYKNVFSTPKWYPDGMSSMHQNRSCPDKIANGIEALVDMYLLAECDYLIYPGCSTFSRIGRLLSDIDPQNIVDIDQFSPKVHLKRAIREFVAYYL